MENRETRRVQLQRLYSLVNAQGQIKNLGIKSVSVAKQFIVLCVLHWLNFIQWEVKNTRGFLDDSMSTVINFESLSQLTQNGSSHPTEELDLSPCLKALQK